MTEPEPLDPPLATMPSTRRAILTSLKRHGAEEAGDLAGELGLSVAAVRQQLLRLTDDGLVTHHRQAEGRGRPAHRYELTAAAENLFPKRYGDLTTELLGYLGGPAGNQVDDLFEHRRQRRLDDARPRLAGLTLDEQVHELARILDEDGYLADVEASDDGWRIIEHNCAILSVASGFRQACRSEIAFIRDALPGAEVTRVSHILDGAHMCAYAIRPLTGRAP
ncbi:MAG TPA: ArsR family transcriptional regulator [Acidimicrobiales bacterium]|nr:ArsR family transcriptional regulator [Acidimicrobiales bacterium]